MILAQRRVGYFITFGNISLWRNSIFSALETPNHNPSGNITLFSTLVGYLFGMQNNVCFATEMQREEDKYQKMKKLINTTVERFQLAYEENPSEETGLPFLNYLLELEKNFLLEKSQERFSTSAKVLDENIRKTQNKIAELNADLEKLGVVTEEFICSLIQYSLPNKKSITTPQTKADISEVNDLVGSIQFLRNDTNYKKVIDTVLLSKDFKITILSQKEMFDTGASAQYRDDLHSITVPPRFKNTRSLKHEFWHAWRSVNNVVKGCFQSAPNRAAPLPFDECARGLSSKKVDEFSRVIQSGMTEIADNFSELLSKKKAGTLTEKDNNILEKYLKVAKDYKSRAFVVMFDNLTQFKKDIGGHEIGAGLQVKKLIPYPMYSKTVYIFEIQKLENGLYKALAYSTNDADPVKALIEDTKTNLLSLIHQYAHDKIRFLAEAEAHLREYPDEVISTFMPTYYADLIKKIEETFEVVVKNHNTTKETYNSGLPRP